MTSRVGHAGLTTGDLRGQVRVEVPHQLAFVARLDFGRELSEPLARGAYFYTPEDSRRRFLRAGHVMFNHLKRRDLGQRMPHVVPGWQATFRNELKQFGVIPTAQD